MKEKLNIEGGKRRQGGELKKRRMWLVKYDGHGIKGETPNMRKPGERRTEKKDDG